MRGGRVFCVLCRLDFRGIFPQEKPLKSIRVPISDDSAFRLRLIDSMIPTFPLHLACLRVIKKSNINKPIKQIRTMLSVARLTATRALTKTCPRAAAATVGSRNMVGFADSMKSKVRSPFDAGICLPSRGIC